MIRPVMLFSRHQDTEPLVNCVYPDLENIACYPCPDGADCRGGAVMVPQQGYWHSAANSSSMNPCLNPQACRQDDDDVQVHGTHVQRPGGEGVLLYTSLCCRTVCNRPFFLRSVDRKKVLDESRDLMPVVRGGWCQMTSVFPFPAALLSLPASLSAWAISTSILGLVSYFAASSGRGDALLLPPFAVSFGRFRCRVWLNTALRLNHRRGPTGQFH